MGLAQFKRACVVNWHGMVNVMDQQQVDNIVCDRIGSLVDILGGEVGALQRASDRKMAAELKRAQISFAAVWQELGEIRDKIQCTK